ncbi:MAG: outer membrane lipoprotein-sorting protein [Verrucomicrobia bacterium]|nr:outer membrane lipoprotein-sorting protein [Verrucomicrobiota bacterium]MCH8514074.1 outer membrane lipoprotein-sorting protein [Kiritimatiellia bacterium]
MQTQLKIRIISILLPVFLTGSIWAEEAPPVNEIIRRAEKAAYYAGKDGVADVKMVIHDASGGTREREFRILRWNGEDGQQKFYVYFNGPADVRRMAYLVWKHGPGRDDDRWLWLPSLGRVNRIAPGDKRTSFVGSDFVYEDVSGRDPNDDEHELVEVGETQYHIRSVPKDKGSVEFASYEVWIDRETHLPVKAEYTDSRGNVYRRVTADRIEVIDGHPTVIVSTVEDLSRNSKTVNTFSNIQYDVGLNENIFSERFLRRPPREAVR